MRPYTILRDPTKRTQTMKLGELAKLIVATWDAPKAVGLSARLTHKWNLNATGVWEFVNKHTGIDRAEWEELLKEA